MRGLQQGRKRTEAGELVSTAHMAKENIKYETDGRDLRKQTAQLVLRVWTRWETALLFPRPEEYRRVDGHDTNCSKQGKQKPPG